MSHPPFTILGIVLVRNEDLFVRQAVENIVGFCDKILLMDHASRDGTPGILAALAARHPDRIEFRRISNPRESHEVLKPWFGKRVWGFAVDGDEIYDPVGLRRFREKLDAGIADQAWKVFGNVVHCTRIDAREGWAEGFPTPPSRSMTKLHNFAAIDSWDGDDTVERLHRGNPAFRPGFSEANRLDLFTRWSWEESPYRCLHMCHLRRSSLDPESPVTRDSSIETYQHPPMERLRRLAKRLLGRPEGSTWKRKQYGVGTPVRVPTAPFFPTVSPPDSRTAR